MLKLLLVSSIVLISVLILILHEQVKPGLVRRAAVVSFIVVLHLHFRHIFFDVHVNLVVHIKVLLLLLHRLSGRVLVTALVHDVVVLRRAGLVLVGTIGLVLDRRLIVFVVESVVVWFVVLDLVLLVNEARRVQISVLVGLYVLTWASLAKIPVAIIQPEPRPVVRLDNTLRMVELLNSLFFLRLVILVLRLLIIVKLWRLLVLGLRAIELLPLVMLLLAAPHALVVDIGPSCILVLSGPIA